jgi:hypothetical protein
MINTIKDRKNLYMRLDKLAIIRKLRVLFDSGAYILRSEDSKIVPRVITMAWECPWIYTKPLPGARCDIYHKVFFRTLDHVHTYCRNCWKVVVRPRNLVELFNLYEFQREMGVPCKCGIERRQAVEGLYGGYFYTRSKEQGLERYKEVRELTSERLSPETPVILKRYCTEFELGGWGKPGFGPSDQLPDTTDEEKEMEEWIEHHFPPVGYNTLQPDHLAANVMMAWIDYAFTNGDETYKEFTDGKRLSKDYVTYHDK